MPYTVTITRGDAWDTSYDLWAKRGSVPLEEGDGVFLGNYPIAPDKSSVSATPTLPNDGTFGILVVPIRRRQGGPSGTYSP